MTARSTLATRTTLLTTGVAVAAVVIAFFASYPLLAKATDSQVRRNLARQATLITAALDRTSATANGVPALRPAVRKLIEQLRQEQGIDVVRITPRGVQSGGTLPSAYVSRLLAGSAVSAVSDIGNGREDLEGRPVASGGAVALLQPVSRRSELLAPIRKRLGIALVLGLAVAILAGLVLARRVSKPLRAAAAGAHRLAMGERGVAIEAIGPAEVAEVAEALTALDRALTTSEQRQRDFLLSVSHELRTPLTSIRGFAEALEDGIAGDATQAGATIKAESIRLERLVSDLLDLARLDAVDFRVELETVDLCGLVDAAGVVWSSRAAAAGCEVTVERPDSAVLARADAGRLRQVLDGLADNALRVAPEGTPIVFAVRSEQGWAVLEVRDGGPGLTDDDCRIAFQRAVLHDRYRGSRRVGTGVGLALVAGLVERMDGSASAGHAPEGGASFQIRLPAG